MFIRRMPPFTYHAPETLTEALDLLSRFGGDAAVFAGGTDLFPAMKRRERTPRHLVNLKGITGLTGISRDAGGGIRIGALTTLGELERSDAVREHLPVLRQTVGVMASPQIRTLATIGGNLCNAVSSADTAPPLIVLQASARLVGPAQERTVLIEHLFQGPKKSILRSDEILTEVLIPQPPESSGGVYLKLMRRSAMDMALVGVAVFLRMDARRKVCEEARIALGAVAPTPIRAPEAEAILCQREINEALAAEAACAASGICCPRSGSFRASEDYRRSMVEVLTKRAILAASESIARYSYGNYI